MTTPRAKRLMREIQDCRKEAAVSGISVEPFDDAGDDMSHLLGTFPGPTNSPYENGHFEVDIVVPQTYPFQPLKMKFVTKTYHPNVSSQSGAICLDILKDAWTPVLTLRSALVSLQSLLCSPEPDDPQDAEVAKVYRTDKDAFERTARYWTEVYAKPRNGKLPSSSSTSSTTTTTSSSSSSTKPSQAPSKPAVDPIQLAGLNSQHVQNFTALGFPQDKVIDVLSRLNYRGKNVKEISDDKVLDELLRG